MSAPVSGIQPSLLRWARTSANMPVSVVAAKLRRPVAEIESWENGESAPSYPQLEKLAYELYKRPLATFFLPAPPSEPDVKAEFRSLPDEDLETLSRDTLFLIRKARAYQLALRELFGERTPADRPIWRTIQLSTSQPVARQANQIRNALGVSIDQQRAWQDDDTALKQWRRAIEARGVFVFKHTFKQREISGFCLSQAEFPVIMINNSTTKTRQVFSLLHELAHVLFMRDGISTFDETRIEGLPVQDKTIERFCNAIAAEVLVPMADFRAQIRGLDGNLENAGEDQFAALAKRYHVSRAVVLRRMLDEKRVSASFYQIKSSEWDAQKKAEGSGGNYHATQNAYLSERFLQEVFARYARRQISRDEVADFIDIKPRNVERLQDLVLRGAAA
ncbi:MAG: XRE family transcriptional regulator [Alphaproteobacteria bacterium]|nr:XRE family transcriptional regulator [Alphaproteobacteria bacterium]